MISVAGLDYRHAVIKSLSGMGASQHALPAQYAITRADNYIYSGKIFISVKARLALPSDN